MGLNGRPSTGDYSVDAKDAKGRQTQRNDNSEGGRLSDRTGSVATQMPAQDSNTRLLLAIGFP